MSAIQASIMSLTNNERRVARSTSMSALSSTAAMMAVPGERGGRRGESMPAIASRTSPMVIGGGEGATAGGGGVGGYSTQMRRNSITIDSSLSKFHPKRPVLDLAVAIIAIPTLIIFALMLETNLRENWAETEETRWAVLGIGLGMIIISLLLCGYVTHRMGVCLWAGPQEDPDSYSNFNRDPSTMDIYSIGADDQFPPSYESVIEYDITAPPPPYDCIMHECIVVLDPTPLSPKEVKKYPVTVQLIDEHISSNYI